MDAFPLFEDTSVQYICTSGESLQSASSCFSLKGDLVFVDLYVFMRRGLAPTMLTKQPRR